MKRITFISIVVLCAVILDSCSTSTPLPATPTPTHVPVTPTPNHNPKIIEHPEPIFQVDMGVFERTGNCDYSTDPAIYLFFHTDTATYICGKDSPLYALGCEYLQADDRLGGLSPYPIAKCINKSKFIGTFEYVSSKGGFWYSYSYVTYDGGNFVLVQKPDDFKKYFAPIESANEALSYLEAVSDYYPKYNFEEYESYSDYYVNEIETTHVEETDDGYIAHVFYGKHPGWSCATVDVYSADVLVTHEGEIREIGDRQLTYSYTMCFD
jgi:hypothetical protein